MASELQRRKTAVVFSAMDVDSDGFLEREDFEELARRWTERRGLTPGGPEFDRLRAVMVGWWDTLVASSDADRDGKVTIDEVLSVVDVLPADPAPVHETARAMFQAVDESGDGRISAAEYKQVIEAWSGVPTDTDAVFGLLDGDGDGYLAEDEFVELWTEFWAGDDPNAAGTWVFGRF